MDSLSNFTIWELLEISFALNVEIIKRTWWLILLLSILLIVCDLKKR